ncbi:SDR family NAD(P)-dependent oxidoreductase [Pseudomaricurvus sp. HS19]|uniref:SDR family NAD(P)-dependent oxidoreductase n=1 Tax=Pseudomaricurvus sp. HS19 TaxID=2692626 RepID=UPI00136D6FAD|nr:SDR family oxidoreductase [Pseudomaricurvus sp. HS19]MYM63039.1 SDR family oxidoreductase [Pseudomaricurvus sp. HS19]
MTERLKGKVAIVFGAGQLPGPNIGNGRACALQYAREGARVACVDLDLAAAEATRLQIAGAGGDAIALQADVTREADCLRAVQACVEAFGPVDILHNNVGGVSTDRLDPAELDESIIDSAMALNFKSVVYASKAVLPSMRGRKSGCIINISSMAAVCSGQPVMYGTTKLALNGLTHQMAMAYAADGVRVNAIMPGLLDTPVAVEGVAQRMGVDADVVRQQRDARVPLRHRQGSAWDVAHAAVFLASDEAGFITGVVLPVDGGQTARIG